MANQPSAYRTPELLLDLVLLDMLEITGTTTAAAREMQLSQPTVSRRYQAIARDLGLSRQREDPPGRRYGHNSCLRLLRKGVSLHRWQAGVLRLGCLNGQRQAMAQLGLVQWAGLDRTKACHWAQLLRCELLDGVVLAGGAEIPSGLERFQRVELAWPSEATSKRESSAPNPQVIHRRHPQIKELVERSFACSSGSKAS